MKVVLLLNLLVFSFCLEGQVIADFEEFNLPEDAYDNGSNGEGGFASGGIYLPNSYSADFDAWTGWALSTVRDSLTPGFQNQYATIAGGGAENSKVYAVGYAFDPIVIHLQDQSETLEGIYVSNATYPYLSMRDGDAFSKKFGGVSGSDPDFFRMTFRKYQDGLISEDSIDFYLADFRFENSAEDYIVDDWVYIDLSSFGQMDSLSISLSSSDVGVFGMNTPAYFCVDRIVTEAQSTLTFETGDLLVNIFPNPVTDLLQIALPSNENFILSIYTLDGIRTFRRSVQGSASFQIDVHEYPAGNYLIQIENKGDLFSSSFLKN
ncbi:MAG: DUF4465 domain-containing protein [Saprospiraceae bacterium]|nr:DUF4465 domain-containing protein [Saprospiraceae bacterium]